MTSTFTCKRCGYCTKYKHVLVKHLERKNICEPKFDDTDVTVLIRECGDKPKKMYECMCGKSFDHEPSLYRHKRTCSKHIDCKANKALIEELQEKLASVEKELCCLKDQCKSEPHIIGDQYNVNNTTINNNTYVVMVNNFGSEDVSHVIEDKQFLDDCLKMLQTSIPNVVNKIYYDESKPENKTVVLKSAKRKTAMVHVGNGQWQETDLNQVVPLMVRKGSRILTNHLLDKDVLHDDTDAQDAIDTKQMYMINVSTQKKPEYDIVSSAVKASIFNHR